MINKNQQERMTFSSIPEATSYFTNQQNALKLEELLNPDKLNLSEFRHEAHIRLDKLEQLLAQYKHFYAQIITGTSKEMLDITSELDKVSFQTVLNSSTTTLNQKMFQQALFFKARESWINNTRIMLNILENNKQHITYDGETFAFNNDELLIQFDICIAAMDEAADFEAEFLKSKRVSMLNGLRKIWGIIKS
ncbi:hypothetical protein [Shewanella sp. TC10]|uniref:hypothetical protein n=1 Tax=Shewanella sp. TC10 TaxID=1419739 RepID=UPI00129E4C9D|nr:hypothetical protein [Shewanella sp. TC10]